MRKKILSALTFFLLCPFSFLAAGDGNSITNFLSGLSSQTITFSAVTKIYGDVDFSPATASSGLPVTYSSDNLSVAIIIGGTQIHIVGAGTANITASQAGNGTYSAAANVKKTLTVNKAALTAKPNNATREYGDSNPPFPIIYSGFVNGEDVSVIDVLPTATSVDASKKCGSYDITASGGNDNNYTFIYQKGTLTITKVTIMATIVDTSRIYNTNNPIFRIIYTGSFKNGENSSAIGTKPIASTLALKASDVGTYPISLSGGSATNYNIVFGVNGTLTITKAPLEITPKTVNKAYGADLPVLKDLILSPAVSTNVLSTLPTLSTTATKNSDVGTYPIIITGGTSNNYAITLVNGILNVTKAQLKVNAAAKTKEYLKVNPSLTFTYSGFVLGQDQTALTAEPTISTTALTNSPVGSYPITLNGGIAANYYFTLNNNTLKITKASQTITSANPISISFTAPDFNPATASSGLTVSYLTTNSNIIDIVNGNLHVKGTGQVTVIAAQIGNESYLDAPEFPILINVGRSDQTVSFSGNITKTYNDPAFNPGATASSGLPVTYSTGNSSVAVTSFEGISIVGAGTTTITATQSGSELYNAASATITLTVEKAAQAITFEALSALIYTYPDFNPGAISDSHLDVIYSTDNPSVATIINNLVHIVGTGNVKITAAQPGNSNYKAATDVFQNLVINKASQTITFNSFGSKIYGDPDFDLDANSSSGLAVTFISSNTSVATIVGNKVHIVGPGSTTISAVQSGNGNYLSATTITKTLNVNKASQTINFSSIPEKATDQPNFNLTATASSGLIVNYTCDNSAVATVLNGVVTIVGTGTANITAHQSGNSNYFSAPDFTQRLIVKNSSQSISFGTLTNKTFGDADFTISASASSNLPVRFFSDNINIATITNNIVKILGAGTVNIYAFQDGDDNFAAATPVFQSLTISKLNQAINFPSIQNNIYTDQFITLSATSNSGLPVEYTSSNPLVAIVMGEKIFITGVGVTIITASQGGDQNYFSASPISQNLTVAKSSQTITFENIPVKTYGDAAFKLNATSSSNLEISYVSSNPLVASIVNGKIHINGVGTSIITASQAGNENYYAASLKAQVLNVLKSSQTIDFGSLPEVKYGSQDFQIEATSSSGLPVTFTTSNSNIFTVINGIVHVNNVGSAYVIATQNGNGNYNGALPVSQLLTVNKIDQIIVFDSIPEKTYGDSDFEAGAISSSGLIVSYTISNPNVAIIKNGKTHIVGVGTATITASQSGNNNYIASQPVSQTLKVSKAVLNVIPLNVSRNYQENNPAFTCNYSGFVYSETSSTIDIPPTITTDATNLTFPGVYDLIASGGFDNNYSFTYQKGTLLILGTMPLKPAKPEGKTTLCINSPKQEYKTAGSVFASTYIWSIKPTEAGIVSGTGKTLTLTPNMNFTGRIAIAVKAKNNQGFGETSDTLYIDVLSVPTSIETSFRGTFCSANMYGDSIKILNSPPFYQYQLYKNDEKYNEILVGTGNKIGWSDLRTGYYNITEEVCNISIAEKLEIKEVDPSSTKPQLEMKWDDVIICLNNGDSIEVYQWYKNGNALSNESKQYIWTQKQEGYYSIKTMDINGCFFKSDSIWIEKQSEGIIFPNPNNGNFKVTYNSNEHGKLRMRISTLNSLPVKTLVFDKNDNLFETDISIPEIKPGIYFIEIFFKGDRVFYEKFIRD